MNYIPDAISTEYAGKWFKSRLEARWAFFFDRLGIHWEYEPERFQIDEKTSYLPDFKIINYAGLVIPDDKENIAWIRISPKTTNYMA